MAETWWGLMWGADAQDIIPINLCMYIINNPRNSLCKNARVVLVRKYIHSSLSSCSVNISPTTGDTNVYMENEQQHVPEAANVQAGAATDNGGASSNVRLPEFWPHDPVMWFKQAEAGM
jgi:hypothetical protein